MIEAIMYFGIGFLFAALIGLALAPLIHDRAVRLTMRRLENSIPQSMAEIQADKDLLRAEFAMSTRRLEIGVTELKEQNTNQLAELGRKSDVINRFKLEREAQKVEALALKSEVGALKQRLFAVGKTNASEYQRHEPDVASLVRNDWPRAEPQRSTTGSAVQSEQRHDSEVLSLVIDRPVTEEAAHADAGRALSGNRGTGVAEDAGDAGLLRAQHSVHVSPDDQVAHEASLTGGRMSRNLRSVFVVSLVGVGATSAWLSYGNETKRIVSAWTAPLSRVVFAPTEKSASPSGASAAPSAEVARQIDALSRELADMRSNVEQSTAKQNPTSHDAPTAQALEPGGKQEVASADPEDRSKLAPYPETKPTTIAGWALLEVVGGTAVVQGPNGVWRVTRGDTVPGVGRVDSIVRWGNRWIVATSSGLISTP